MKADYFKLVVLEDEVKRANKIKVGATVPRYDCVTYAGNKDVLKPFINRKGMMYLRLMESKEFVKADKKGWQTLPWLELIA